MNLPLSRKGISQGAAVSPQTAEVAEHSFAKKGCRALRTVWDGRNRLSASVGGLIPQPAQLMQAPLSAQRGLAALPPPPISGDRDHVARAAPTSIEPSPTRAIAGEASDAAARLAAISQISRSPG